MVAIANPVGQGLVASFAQPGGNVTGLSGQYEDLVRKMPELLKDMVPKASHIAVLADGAIPSTVGFLRESQTTAQALGVKLLPVEVRGPNDFDGAFSAMMNRRPDALITLPSSLLYFQHKRIADFAKAGGLPAIGPWAEFAEAGGLMSYGLNLPEFYRRAATYVDKILKGTRPGDLPVEQPTHFEFVVNLKTAKALGITVPQSVLMRADKVIE
jgi:putative ABC transport system substrate-binding protein